jgi:hypothetical protein
MKTILLFLASAALLCQSVHAAVPKKAPAVKYTGLWTNSPFTSKPPVVDGPPPENPLDDYTLTGIAPVPGGYRITIINKKNPDDKKVIEPGGTDKDFTVVSVDRNPEKALGTTVVLSTGTMEGTVSFEPELITLKAAPAAAPQQQGNLPPGVTPAMAAQKNAQKNGSGENTSPPRPRIVPPPTKTPSTSASGNRTSTQSGSRDNKTPSRIERRR